jgi:hypothetical protein
MDWPALSNTATIILIIFVTQIWNLMYVPYTVHPFRVHSKFWVTSAHFACLLYRRRFNMYVESFRKLAPVPVPESFSWRLSKFFHVCLLYVLQKLHHELGYLSWLVLSQVLLCESFSIYVLLPQPPELTLSTSNNMHTFLNIQSLGFILQNSLYM